MIMEIDLPEMRRLLDEEKADLIDVREDEEVAQGNIEGHKHWPLSRFEEYEGEISQDRPTIFYCRSGKRSLRSAAIAEAWTDQPLYSLAGGYLGYVSENKD